ncbi:MAG: hypothetical protein AVDCRST_MAG59-1249 [uncultured Thermomicrobiales bacterium]|jgi:putative FmdB family regulatory protein|uniref:Putative regulatory protein FmdB zinc ribbon domain-containing protein n=1 Tax=uncultured Thermomicrobiales bacterium TaxID=1645740 RepID=A0A6J4UAI6_9BACT|nr:MAG: hypothetical protein AVDCRST_MAG59-1249 [uncultured Thermomicrobiales bacterium]
MPTYAYQCQACAHAFDAFQKFSDDPLTVCPECQGRIRRVIHPTPVVFKGSGWYITDSKNGGTNGKSDRAKADDDGAKTDDAAKPKDDAKVAKADTTEKKPDQEKSPAKADKGEKKTPAPVAATAD